MLDDVLGILEAETGRPRGAGHRPGRRGVHVADGAQRGAVPVLDVRPHVTMQVLGLVVDGSRWMSWIVAWTARGCRGAGRPQGRRPRTRTGAP